jgi:TolA-binding protein
MRKLILSLAAAGTALAFASPASAQYYPQPQPQPYGYGAQPYGYGYGQNNWGQVRALQVRIDGIQRQIESLSARRILRRSEAKDLRKESRSLERRLHEAGRNGLNYREMQTIQYRIARLEQHVHHEATDGNRWGRGNAYNGSYGYNAYDRDRDGRDDRYENDRGHDRDD